MFRKQSSYIPLDESTIVELKAALLDDPGETGNFRYSRKYLNEILGIKIDRGGILRLEDPDTNEPSLWAVVKVEKPEGRRALLLGVAGTFGKVKLIENIETGEYKALKVLYNKKGMEGFLREADFLKQLGRGRGDVIEKRHPLSNQKKPCIVMDYIPGQDLYEILSNGRLSKLERIEIFLKILQEVKEMHALELLHCDIKPENVMYDEKTGKVRLIDYGLMKKFSELDRGNFLVSGTCGFVGPEVVRSCKYSPASDIFSLGRVARELFGFLIVDELFKKMHIGKLDKNAKKAFNRKERRLLLSNLILPMEDEKKDNRIPLNKAIEETMRILAFCRNEDSCDNKNTQTSFFSLFSFWKKPKIEMKKRGSSIELTILSNRG